MNVNGNDYTFTLFWNDAPEVDETGNTYYKLIDEYGFVVEGSNMTLSNNTTAGTSVFTFSAELQKDKRYTILISPSIFGDAKWVESNHDLGTTNPQIRYDFYPEDVSVGVDKINGKVEANNIAKSVYTPTGLMLYPDATELQISNLPAGFYIISGRKVIIR